MTDKSSKQTPKQENRKKIASSAKEIAYVAVYTALLIGSQLVLSAVPGVEVVTVLFVVYAYAFGFRRGMVVATAFSLLRQIVFGFFPVVLLLYLIYFNLLTLIFGKLGEKRRVKFPWLVVIACVCTVFFTMLDNVLTAIWYGYTWEMAEKYFLLALPVAGSQTVCTAVTVATLFLPLTKILSKARNGLSN